MEGYEILLLRGNSAAPMNQITTFSFFLFFVSHAILAQEEKSIKGKIVIKDATPLGVSITNLNNEKEVFSNAKGEFTILAKPSDVLVFYSINLDNQRKIIDVKEYEAGNFSIEMTSKVTELNEVEILIPKFDAVSLRVLSKPAKKFTPAERRLATAGEFRPIQLLGLLGGSLPLDPLINSISGRTSKLKKEVKIEKREQFLEKIEENFDDGVFMSEVKIPLHNIGEFKQFLIDHTDFTNALTAKNKVMAFFIMSKLATEYLNLIQHEKQ